MAQNQNCLTTFNGSIPYKIVINCVCPPVRNRQADMASIKGMDFQAAVPHRDYELFYGGSPDSRIIRTQFQSNTAFANSKI
jgi:hypothetical protein